MRGCLRRSTPKCFDLDQTAVGAAPLRKSGSSDIERQMIGVSMCVEFLGGRVEPRAGRQPHDARYDVLRRARASEATSAIVEQQDHIAIGDLATLRIFHVDGDDLAPRPFAGDTVGRMVELAVQSPLWLIGEKMQRIIFCRLSAKPFRRRLPGRMADTIRDAGFGDIL